MIVTPSTICDKGWKDSPLSIAQIIVSSWHKRREQKSLQNRPSRGMVVCCRTIYNRRWHPRLVHREPIFIRDSTDCDGRALASAFLFLVWKALACVLSLQTQFKSPSMPATSRGVVTSRLSIPVRPGPLTLKFPEWVPGADGPLGPIGRFGGIKILAGGKLLEWKRDPLKLFSFHLVAFEGASTIEAELAYVLQARADYLEVSLGIAASGSMGVINWNPLILYPEGADPSTQMFHARLLLPAGWKLGSSLTTASERAGDMVFRAISLEQLIDSPVLAGKNIERYTLPGTGPVPQPAADRRRPPPARRT